MSARRTALWGTAIALPLSLLSSTHASAATTGCDSMRTAVQQVVRPSDNSTLDTPWAKEASQAGSRYGYTQDNGTIFRSRTSSATGLVPVHRLFKAATSDFVLMPKGPELDTAVSKYGYEDQGVRVYAASSSASGCVPVVRYSKGSMHRMAATSAQQSALTGADWTRDKVAFYAAPATSAQQSASWFSIAVLPDTQQEVFGSDPRFDNRAKWLVSRKDTERLRFVGHTGDVTNWGWLAPGQLDIAERGAATLRQGGLPYAFSVGNHDTRAVGWDGVEGSRKYGGAAYESNPECPERLGEKACYSPTLVRNTTEFNQRFKAADYGKVAGAYQSGKVDNIYSRFSAGGRSWLVLTLELWPRTGVIDWARQVVAGHPQDNVIVQTHSYLESDGRISTSNGGYGANSPKTVYDRLISQYPNIKMVFSGHTGQAASRTDTGVHGNKIASFLQAMHSNETNPVRMVRIDPDAGTISSRIYGSATDETFSQYSVTISGMDF